MMMVSTMRMIMPSRCALTRVYFGRRGGFVGLVMIIVAWVGQGSGRRRRCRGGRSLSSMIKFLSLMTVSVVVLRCCLWMCGRDSRLPGKVMLRQTRATR